MFARQRSWYIVPLIILALSALALVLAGCDSTQSAGTNAPPTLTGTPDKTAAITTPETTSTATKDISPSPAGTSPTIATTRTGKLFQITLPDSADSRPVYLDNVQTTQAVRNLVFVTTRDGSIVALDANTGTQIWLRQNPAGSCRINNGSNICYTTSAPALDPNRKFVYSYGLDGYVHKYAVADGTEIKEGGCPELATRKPNQEKGSSWLAVATAGNGTSYLYMANGGYPGDRGDYQGHITTIDLATGQQHVFNTVCSDQVDVHFAEDAAPDCAAKQTAVWSRIPVVYDPDTDRIYATTGNGDFDPAKHSWGDTVFALNPDGTGANGDPLDTYTPTNFQSLQDGDIDIGSTAPVVLPVPANSKVKHLAVQSGKDAKLRLLNLDNLSGKAKTGQTGGEIGTVIDVPQGGRVLTVPVAWGDPQTNTTWLFVASSNGVAGLKLSIDGAGIPQLNPAWKSSGNATTPFIAGNVLFYAESGNAWALDPRSGKQLWHDTQIGDIHWESTFVANGILYISDNNRKLTAYSVKDIFQ